MGLRSKILGETVSNTGAQIESSMLLMNPDFDPCAGTLKKN